MGSSARFWGDAGGGAVAWTKMVAMDVVKSGYILERYSVRFPDRLQ